MFAGFRMVMTRGESGEFDQAKSAVKWGIIGAIIINISYALVYATFNLGFTN